MLSSNIFAGVLIKLLVTGATGFVGRHLVSRLIEEGHEVHTLIRPKSAYPSELNGAKNHIYNGNSEDIQRCVESSQPEVVFHLASHFLAEHQSTDIRPLIESNITFGTELVEAMIKRNCTKLVTAGTSWQNSGRNEGVAVCLYAATKQAFEDILKFYTDAYPLQVTVLKLFDTYGPRDTRRKLLALLKSAAQNQKPIGLSPGEQLLDLMHVKDTVAAFIHAAKLFKPSTEGSLYQYYLRSEKTLTVRELVDLYNQVSETKIPAKFGERPYRSREVMTPWAQGPTLPGWCPSISLIDGLREYAREASHV